MRAFTGYMLLVSAALLVGGLTAVRAAPPPGYTQVWSDEFSGTSIDTSKWNIRNNAGYPDVTYRTSAVSVANGVMTIKTYGVTGNYSQGWIDTNNKFMPKYGYFEARINFNTSSGVWSDFWIQSPGMMDPNVTTDTSIWGSEIDVIEHRAYSGTTPYDNHIYMANHWGGYGANADANSKNITQAGMGNGSWHTYGLLWTPTEYKFYWDGVEKWSQTANISGAPQYLIFSSELHPTPSWDSWSGAVLTNYGTVNTTTTTMQVDYVRVYAVPEPGVGAMLAGAAMLLAGRRRR